MDSDDDRAEWPFADPEEAYAQMFEQDPEQVAVLELERKRVVEKQAEARERRAPATRARKAARAAAGAPVRMRRSRLWGALLGDSAKAAADRAKLVEALGATNHKGLVPGNPGGKKLTVEQRAARKEVLTKEVNRVRALERVDPLAKAAVAAYPERLARLMAAAPRRWKLPDARTGYPGSGFPKEVSHYARLAARGSLRDARLGQLRESSGRMAIEALPPWWIRQVITEAGRDPHDSSIYTKVREAGDRLLRHLEAIGSDAAACEELRRLAGDRAAEACPHGAFTSWSSALFDTPGKRAGSPRFRCNSEWPQLVCVLVRGQIEDWLKLSVALDDGERITHRDLVVGAKVAAELGPLLGARFAALAGPLAEPAFAT